MMKIINNEKFNESIYTITTNSQYHRLLNSIYLSSKMCNLFKRNLRNQIKLTLFNLVRSHIDLIKENYSCP